MPPSEAPPRPAPAHHPLFARIYTRLSEKDEERGRAEHRQLLLSGLSGRVIEVGAGNGLNFAHYPPAVEEVVAVEPEPYLRERAREAAVTAPVRVTLAEGLAEDLPAESGEFDAAVASLVLCSVADQRRALCELLRVLRPDGELRFYEHVISERPRGAWIQRVADRAWPRLAGGCHLSRDTSAAIEAAGFRIQSSRRFPFGPLNGKPPIPHILGVARRPAEGG